MQNDTKAKGPAAAPTATGPSSGSSNAQPDKSKPTAPAAATQAAEIDANIICWSLVENTATNTEQLIDQLNAALAMGRAGSAPGFIHGLRRARDVWIAIAGDAKKFAEITATPPPPGRAK